MPRMIATVELYYDGPIPAKDVQELLASAIEHCRQENMLSDPEDDEIACEWVDVIAVEESTK